MFIFHIYYLNQLNLNKYIGYKSVTLYYDITFKGVK